MITHCFLIKKSLNPKECLHHSNCGWCGATGTCITGSNLGPQTPCTRSSYIYSAPYPAWDAASKVITGQIGGISLAMANNVSEKMADKK